MRYGKTVAGATVLGAAAVLYFLGNPLAVPVAAVGAGLISVGMGHKLDRLLDLLGVLKK